MRVEHLGEGPPEVAVVGGIHGDEPCGVRAIERLLTDDPVVNRSVALVVANEEALERGVRYVDEDLNRAFPGDPQGASHEARLAHRLRTQLEGCVTFSMHSTQSHESPFAIVREVDGLAEAVCPYLSIAAVVESAAFSEGRLIEHADVIEVECGLQGSQAAADNAYRLVREFLGAVGALPRQEPATDGASESTLPGSSRITAGSGVPVLRLVERIPKRKGVEHEVYVENFERVDAGEPYAATDGETLVAEAPFYPVLVSPYGYEDQFGYAAEPVGRLEA